MTAQKLAQKFTSIKIKTNFRRVSDRFRICRNFTVKFGTSSEPGKSGLVSSENLFKALQRKHIYGTILANLCRAVEWKLFKAWSYFRTVCLCDSCARKLRNLGALFKVIRSVIGRESAVSQTPPEQSINLCKRLLQTLSGKSPIEQECSCRFLCVGKSLPQVFEICRRIRTKMILKRSSGKNLGKNSDSEKNIPSENQFVVFMRVTLKWTYLIWLTDLSLGNQHYHAMPIRKLRLWTNGFFKIVGFAGKRFLSSLPLPLLVIFCARPNFRIFKKRKMLQTCGKPYGNACFAG